jgi:hypothetical protein
MYRNQRKYYTLPTFSHGFTTCRYHWCVSSFSFCNRSSSFRSSLSRLQENSVVKITKQTDCSSTATSRQCRLNSDNEASPLRTIIGEGNVSPEIGAFQRCVDFFYRREVDMMLRGGRLDWNETFVKTFQMSCTCLGELYQNAYR